MGDIDFGTIFAIGATLLGAWWAMAKLMFNQFEKRQDERFAGLQSSIAAQKTELDGHLGRQDLIMSDIRRIESDLARSQLEAANRFQTKDDAGKQFGQLIQEIRGLGSRIDALHVRGNGMAQQ